MFPTDKKIIKIDTKGFNLSPYSQQKHFVKFWLKKNQQACHTFNNRSVFMLKNLLSTENILINKETPVFGTVVQHFNL